MEGNKAFNRIKIEFLPKDEELVKKLGYGDLKLNEEDKLSSLSFSLNIFGQVKKKGRQVH